MGRTNVKVLLWYSQGLTCQLQNRLASLQRCDSRRVDRHSRSVCSIIGTTCLAIAWKPAARCRNWLWRFANARTLRLRCPPLANILTSCKLKLVLVFPCKDCLALRPSAHSETSCCFHRANPRQLPGMACCNFADVHAVWTIVVQVLRLASGHACSFVKYRIALLWPCRVTFMKFKRQ